MKTQVLRFTLILLVSLTFSTPTTISVAQTQDYSRVNLPDGAIARLGKGGVSYEEGGIAFSPDGSRLAVATSIGIWLYDAETFDEIALLTGDMGEVSTVVFSSDSTKLAAAARHWPNTLKLWEVETGQNLATFQVQKGPATTVAFSPSGTKLAWAGRLWDVETRQQLDILQDNRLSDVTFSPDGKILAGTDVSIVKRTRAGAVREMRVGVIKLYDVKTGQPLSTLTVTPCVERISSIAFSPDGQMLASGSAGAGTVKLWLVSTGENIATFQEQKGEINSVVFSPDGTKLAVGSAGGIKLLKVPTGQHIYTRQHINVGELEPFDIFSVAFSPDGTKLASASWDGVKLWEVEMGRNLTTLRGHTRMVNSVAFSLDGLTLASDSVSGAQVWQVATGQHITTLAGPPNFVASLAYSPDGTQLATGSLDGRNTEHTVKLWEISTGKNLTTLHGHTDLVNAVVYSRDGRILASGSEDKTIKLWEVETGQNIATLQGHKKSINSVAFSPDGTKLASGSDDTTIRLWEIPTGKVLYTLDREITPQIPAEVLPAPRPGEEVNKTQTDDAAPVETKYIGGWVQSVAFSPDGTKLAAALFHGGIILWEVGPGQHFTVLTNGLDFSSFSATFSPDGTKLVSGSWANTVELWEISTQKHIATFPGHTGNVYTVAFSPDGTKLASGSFDGTVLLWDVPKSIKLYPSKQHSDR